MNYTNILLRHNFIAVPNGESQVGPEALATVMMNLSHYGYGLSQEAYQAVSKLEAGVFAAWWEEVEKELKSITGADRKMADFVVYKNFPAEVLSKSEADYWVPQLLMYWGFPNEYFTETVQPREKLKEQPDIKVLRKAKVSTLKDIMGSYLKSPSRWKDQELEDVLFLTEDYVINLAKLSFKENMVQLANVLMQRGQKVHLNTATDVLRLAVGMSDGDISLREKVKFKSFKKSERRFLLSMLETSHNLSEDMARRAEVWKRFLHNLHPGDYKSKYPNVVETMAGLYLGALDTFNGKVERLILNRESKVLDLLEDRPGEFRRRLTHMISLFGDQAVKSFCQDKVLDKLTAYQLVSLRSHLETVNTRQFRTFPPKGNWNKLQVKEDPNERIANKHSANVELALGKALAKRLPKVAVLDENTKKIKLPSNGGDTGTFTRGTVFPIPDGIKFIRTASYWKCKRDGGNVWFDNGWNFFNQDWESAGAICWDAPKFKDGMAAFSGDPTNTKDIEGRACQLIDLYLDKLQSIGVRYAVWNVLCFSSIPFSQAEEVFAALQWGEDAQKGELFDPSRNQLAFPLTGDQLTKFVCLIDLKEREMVYLDANLKGQTGSAQRNSSVLEKTMPAFMEYLEALPSVHDLFRNSVDPDQSNTHILYSDKDVKLHNIAAYVFKPENKENKYKVMDLNGLLT